METNTTFAAFENGALAVPGMEKPFAPLPWNNHPAFDGVALKHLVTGAESGGLFSYHLVRIQPGRAIGDHLHDPQLETHEVVGGAGACRNGDAVIDYRPGTLSIFQPRVRHSVEAGETGLLILAKFMPPLC